MNSGGGKVFILLERYFFMLPLFFIGETLELFGELGFLIKLLVFAYLLYWLYMTFGNSGTLFGLSALVTAYFLLFHGISTILVVGVWVFFVLFGGMIQQALWFGLGPIIASITGKDIIGGIMWGGAAAEQDMQKAIEKAEKGMELNEHEGQLVQQYVAQQQMGQQSMDQQMMYQHMRRMSMH
jgi:hypothetical protein